MYLNEYFYLETHLKVLEDLWSNLLSGLDFYQEHSPSTIVFGGHKLGFKISSAGNYLAAEELTKPHKLAKKG